MPDWELKLIPGGAGGAGQRSPATVNRHPAAVFGFYDHHARSVSGRR